MDIKQKIQNFINWFKVDKNTWKKRIVTFLGIGIAFAGTSDTLEFKYLTNPKVRNDFNIAGKQFISKDNKVIIGDVTKEFSPEMKINHTGKYFSIIPEGIENVKIKELDITPDGKISFKDKDNGINYNFYYKDKNKCNNGPGVIIASCFDNVEQELILDKYSTNTFTFNVTSTFNDIVINDNGTVNFDTIYKNNKGKEIKRRTDIFVSPIFAIDSIGQMIVASTTFYDSEGQIKQKISFNDDIIKNAKYPITIDPTYVIINGGAETDDSAYSSQRKIARDSNGTLYFVSDYYRDKVGAYEYDIIIASSTDDGKTWTTSSVDNTEGTNFLYPSIAIDGNNNIYVAYEESFGDLILKKFVPNQGWSDQIKVVEDNFVYSPSIAIDGNNNVYIAYSKLNDLFNLSVKVSSSTDGGQNWSSTTLSDENYTNEIPSITIDNNNNVYVSFVGQLTGYSGVILQYSKYNGSSWSSPALIDYLTSSVTGNSISVNKSNNNVIVSYSKNGPSYIDYGVYDGSSFTTSSISNNDNYTQNIISSDKVGYEYVLGGPPGGITTIPVYRKVSSFNEHNNISYSNNTIYTPSLLDANFPSFSKPYFGYAGYFPVGSPLWQIVYFSSGELVWNTSTIYDLSTSTNSTRFAWHGIGNATAVPPTFSRTDTASWIYESGTIFSTAMYNNASTSNNAWATTALAQLTGNGSTSWWYFGTLIHDFEMLIDEPTSTINTSTWKWEGYCSLSSTTNATITAAHDVRMFLYDYSNATFTNVTSSLNASCTSTDCTLEYTTTTPTNISKFFTPSSSKALSRWLVTCPDIGSDCHYAGAAGNIELLCAKIATGTIMGTTTAIGCQPQDPSEDLYNQCATGTTVALGCKTGYCGGIALFGSFPWGCGWIYDGSQGNCPECYGCPSSFNPANTVCEAKTTAPGSGLWGCDGDCETCSSGTCETDSCEGLQCGCSIGMICTSGTCVPDYPANCSLACGGLGSCYPDVGTCLGGGGTPDGNADNCLPTSICCCGI